MYTDFLLIYISRTVFLLYLPFEGYFCLKLTCSTVFQLLIYIVDIVYTFDNVTVGSEHLFSLSQENALKVR